MYSDDDLNAAVAEGAVSAEAAANLRAFVARRRAAPAVDEEHFRLLTGFNDIFVTIAAILILLAVSWLGSMADQVLGAGVALAVTSWGLAEYFTRRRRMALPSIVLLLGFVGGIAVTTAGILVQHGLLALSRDAEAACAAFGAVAAGVHWFRFKVPITIAAGAGAAVWTLVSLALGGFPALANDEMPLLLLGGLGVFAFAMWWDMSDRTRTTRRADVAFWLHLTAAPMIVHPIFSLLGMLHGGTDLRSAAMAVAIYFILAVVAVIVDRRALLVSALLYVLYAMTALFRAAGSESASFALTALVIGSALLLLSAFWHRARQAIVGQLPTPVQARLPVI